MNSEVTLYIPTYNSAKYLPEVIPAVMAQTYPIVEVIIVDGSSTDNSIEIIEEFAKNSTYPIRLIMQAPKKGLADARNIAFKNCHTKYLASADADVVLSPDWLENIMHAFNRHDNIAGVCGTLKERYTDTKADFWRSTHLKQSWGKGEFTNIPFVFGSNNLYVCKDVLDAGLFDSSLIFAGEDYDISVKLKKNQKQLLYTDRAKCEHLRRDSIKSILNTIWRYNYFGGKLQAKGFFRHILSPAVNAVFVVKLIFKDIKIFNMNNFILDITCFPYLTYMDFKKYLVRFLK